MLHSKPGKVRFTLLVAILKTFVSRGESVLYCKNCNDCAKYNDKPWCKTCSTGYYWVNGGHCLECDKNCNKCSSSNCDRTCEHNFGKCVSGCKNGYHQQNDTEKYFCSSGCGVNCRICEIEKCITCKDGYFLRNGRCEVCDVSNCKLCLSQNECFTCEKGHFLKSQQCFKDVSAKDIPKSDNTFIIGAAVGWVMFLIVCIVFAVIIIRRRNRTLGDGNVMDKECPNLDIGLQDREEIANAGTNGSHCSISEEDTYAIPNKLRTNHKKEANLIAKQKSGIEDSSSIEPPVLPAKSNLYYDDSDLEELDPTLPDDDEDTGDVPEDCDTYYNTSIIRRKLTTETLLAKLASHKTDSFKEEFERLADGLIRDYKEALKPENVPRNRYKLVYPYDVSRVIIADSKSNYINASYIDGYNHPKEYIACLGPAASTTDNFEQFWKMIWQEDVEKIVMLTRLMEGSTMKCEQYWPNENTTEIYGEFTIKNLSERKWVEYTVRTLTVIKCGNRQDRDLHCPGHTDTGRTTAAICGRVWMC